MVALPNHEEFTDEEPRAGVGAFLTVQGADGEGGLLPLRTVELVGEVSSLPGGGGFVLGLLRFLIRGRTCGIVLALGKNCFRFGVGSGSRSVGGNGIIGHFRSLRGSCIRFLTTSTRSS